MPHVIPKTDGPIKKVVIVGGGVGGLEAARVCAERGHNVVLFEAADKLGGQVTLASKTTWRKDLNGVSYWLEQRVQELEVDVRLGHFAGPDDVLAENPDVV